MRKAILEEAAATEDGLRRFVTWGSTADQCVLRGQDVLARYDVLMRGGVPAKNLVQSEQKDRIAWRDRGKPRTESRMLLREAIIIPRSLA